MKRLHQRFSWLLLSVFLCQPLIGYLTAPEFAEAKNGQQILICTLKGLQLITLDDSDTPAALVDTGDCPALTLSQITATGLPTEHFGTIVTPQPPQIHRAINEVPPPRQWHYPDYITRAPPIS